MSNNLDNAIKQAVRKSINEAKDRHREGYWKERWAKQKAEKEKKIANGEDVPKEKDRHRKGYYREYNKKHPERLNRGYTKGYINGNVNDGLDIPDNYVIGYDEFGRPITNHPLSDMLRNKEMEWHDDDWCEDD